MVKRFRRASSFVKKMSFPHPHAKLRVFAFANALGIVGVIVSLFYALMTWFGGYNPAVIIDQYPIPFSFNDFTLLIGLLETYVMGYICGWVFSKLYNAGLR